MQRQIERLKRNVAFAKELGKEAGRGEDRAQAGVQAMSKTAIALVVSLTIGGLVAAFLLPVGIDEIVAVNTTDWSTGAQSIWDLLDVVLVLAVMLFFFGITLAATEMVG